ncbi:5-formyltetrahydrofolate cyclo-ligase [Vreelandella alkaliphila]|uniref:5-formyltetrahydrofolate cyclo-ligase n=1 Tax=Vreelandella alkaliphila TaxID=272774 RepID=A0ABX4HHI1_9GAMM|nr:5-formyltetrahydrofolate cyclo-ligase [Halomonas humidisoli]PAU71712.1 5-formyltetrahydrofolate cyclo-ligase [Halomonas humidisoli]
MNDTADRSTSGDKIALRRELRRRRRILSLDQQKQAAAALCQRLKGLPEIRRAKRISLYLPVNGEIDPTPLIPWLRQRKVSIYLPVLRPLSTNRLWFVAYRESTPMVKNRFGIAEPCSRFAADKRNRLPAWALDTLIVPLVGFDKQANRMGMGGGFYDRSLAFMRRRQGPVPTLIGVAHACQQVDALPIEPWDIPLDVIASDIRIIRPTKTG